jgi:hypothetical protein
MIENRRANGEIRIAAYRVAIAAWIFMAIWLTFLGIVTWLYIRDGSFGQFPPAVERGIVVLFWVFGAAGSAYVFGMPLVTLALDGDTFVAREYALRGRRESRFPVTSESRPIMRKTRDAEGDDVYLVEVKTPDGRRIAVGGSSDMECSLALISAMDRIIDRR